MFGHVGSEGTREHLAGDGSVLKVHCGFKPGVTSSAPGFRSVIPELVLKMDLEDRGRLEQRSGQTRARVSSVSRKTGSEGD